MPEKEWRSRNPETLASLPKYHARAATSQAHAYAHEHAGKHALCDCGNAILSVVIVTKSVLERSHTARRGRRSPRIKQGPFAL